MKRTIDIGLLRLLGVALVLLMQFSPLSLAQQSEPSLVKLEGGTEYELSNIQPQSTIRVPVTIRADVAAIAVSLVDVAIGTRHDQTLFKSFCIQMESPKTGSNQVPTILVVVKTVDLPQGKYELLIKAQATEKAPSVDCSQSSTEASPTTAELPKDAKFQFLKLNVTLAAAKFMNVSSITLEQVVPFFGEPETLGSPSLLLWENSGHATRLTGINGNQLDIPSGVNQPTNAQITFEPPLAVTPGEVARAPIKLSGSFPLGSTKGTALVMSPQLGEPLSIGFEIKARRPRSAIVIVMILGLLAGFFLRTWSKHQVEQDEARQKARSVAATLLQAMDEHPDSEFQRQVDDALKEFTRAGHDGRSGALDAGVKDANAALAKAMTDLDNRRALAKDQLAAFARLTQTDWSLPADLVNLLTIDDQELKLAHLEVEDDNIISAKDRLDRLSSRLGENLGPAVSKWRAETKSFLDALGGVAVLISSKGLERLTGETTSASAKLDAIQQTGGGATVDQVITMLTALRDARANVKDLVFIVQIALKGTSAILREQFDEVAVPDKAAIETLISMLDKFQKALPDSEADPETGATTLPAQIVEVTTVWRDAMLKQIAGPPEAVRKVNELCDQKDLLGAVATVVRVLMTMTPVMNEAGDIIEESLVVGAGNLARIAPVRVGGGSFFNGLFSMLSGKAIAPDAAITLTTRERTVLPRLEGLGVLTVNPFWGLKLIKLLRFGISSLVILVVGYALFADKFVGTLSDMMAVFFWGFGIDIGVDTAATEAAKLVKR